MIDVSNSYPETRQHVSDFVELATVDSTNTYLRNNAADVAPFSLVITRDQRAGRGRLGRTWESKPGESLAMSLLLPAPTAQDAKSSSHSLSLIPLLAGASLAATLTDLGVLDVGLKWPNDVQIGGKKAAGILCEVLPTGDIIVGVGINTYFAGPPPTPEAVALAEFIAVDEVTIDHCVAVFISTLRSWCEKSHDVVSDFIRSELSTLGASVEVSELDGSRWTGQATGLSPEGHLQVTRDADGVVVSVVASDIRHLYQ